jgi:hypothetical protein
MTATIEDRVRSWSLPEGIIAHTIPATAWKGVRVAIMREDRYLDEDGVPRAAARTYLTDEGTQIEDVASLPEEDGDGSVHAGELLRVLSIDSLEDLDSLREWAEALEPSPSLDAQAEDAGAAAERACAEAIDEAVRWEWVLDEDPGDYERTPVVWREEDGLHAAMWADLADGEAVVEVVRDAAGQAQRIA